MNSHAFITGPNGAGMTDMGTLGGQISAAFHINDIGEVTGTTQTKNGDTLNMHSSLVTAA